MLALSPLTNVLALDDSMLFNDEKLAIWLRSNISKYSYNSACRAGWDSIYYNFVLVVQWLDTVRGASGSGSLEGVTKLVPDAWLIQTCQRIVGEGQRPAVRQALVNHGLFHAN